MLDQNKIEFYRSLLAPGLVLVNVRLNTVVIADSTFGVFIVNQWRVHSNSSNERTSKWGGNCIFHSWVFVVNEWMVLSSDRSSESTDIQNTLPSKKICFSFQTRSFADYIFSKEKEFWRFSFRNPNVELFKKWIKNNVEWSLI